MRKIQRTLAHLRSLRRTDDFALLRPARGEPRDSRSHLLPAYPRPHGQTRTYHTEARGLLVRVESLCLPLSPRRSSAGEQSSQPARLPALRRRIKLPLPRGRMSRGPHLPDAANSDAPRRSKHCQSQGAQRQAESLAS